VSDAELLPIVTTPHALGAVDHVFEGQTGPGEGIPGPNGIRVGYFVAEPLQLSRGELEMQMPNLAPSSSLGLPETNLPIFGIEKPKPVAGMQTSPLLSPIPPAGGPAPQKIILSAGRRLTGQGFMLPDLEGRFSGFLKQDILTRYYQPQAVTTTDQLNESLIQYQVLADFPSNASLSKKSITWQGVGEISPTLTAIGIGVPDARASNSFIAGVALAIAAAVLIAFLQELNEQLKDARRRREGPRDEHAPPPPRQSSGPGLPT
jgi:hypothetical protein